MAMQQPDAWVQDALNRLRINDVGGDEFVAYKHSLTWYGRDAAAHTILMRNSLKIGEETTLEDFLSGHDILFRDKAWGGYTVDDIPGEAYRIGLIHGNRFLAPITAFERQGLFVPAHVHESLFDAERINPSIMFFDTDYVQMLIFGGLSNEEYNSAKAFIDEALEWKPADFLNREKLLKGLKFGQALWRSCEAEYNKYKHKLPEHIEPLAEALKDHYAAIALAEH